MIVDSSTGEVLDEQIEVKKDKYIVSSREEFFMIYASFLGVIAKLTPIETKLFIILVSYSNAANSVGIGQSDRELIAKKLSEDGNKPYSRTSVFQALKGLVNKNVLIKKQRNIFKINPRYFWKGSYDDRMKALRYFLEIECPDC